MKEQLMKPKVWLIIIGIMHLLMGVIGFYLTVGNQENLGVIMYFGFVCIYLFYAAFMTEGQTQSRLAVVLCAPVVAWFIISAIIKLNMFGHPIAEMPMALLPLFLWTMPALTGFMNWDTK
tara:strand:+ start:703 stop:1062 length:360 start_codon:yes stop_codon:yes gene_type:complete